MWTSASEASKTDVGLKRRFLLVIKLVASHHGVRYAGRRAVRNHRELLIHDETSHLCSCAQSAFKDSLNGNGRCFFFWFLPRILIRSEQHRLSSRRPDAERFAGRRVAAILIREASDTRLASGLAQPPATQSYGGGRNTDRGEMFTV